MSARRLASSAALGVPVVRSPVTPEEVSAVRFPLVARRGRGVDPGSVYAFLARVAEALADRDRTIKILDGENAQIKDALARWQSGQPALLPHRQPTVPASGLGGVVAGSGDLVGDRGDCRPDPWPGWNGPTRADQRP